MRTRSCLARQTQLDQPSLPVTAPRRAVWSPQRAPAAVPAPGATVWLTGLPSAGKTTLATALAARLAADGVDGVELLDGDEVREFLSKGLGFSREDRDTNVLRIGWVAATLAKHGVLVLASVISPYAETRADVRALHEPAAPVSSSSQGARSAQGPGEGQRRRARGRGRAIHVMREVAAEFERPVLLFSGGKDSIVMLRLAEKAFWPAPIPFPLLHVDTGHNFPEVLAFRDQRVAELGARLVVAKVQDSIDAGRVVEIPGGLAQPAADGDAARRHRGGPVRRRLRRRPPRRGEGPRQGARLLLPRRVRPVGPEEPAPRALEPLQRPAQPRRAHPGLPAVQLDRARHLALHRPRGHRGPVDLLRARARGLRARRHAARRHAVLPSEAE